MIAIAGTIGTGLFLGTGRSLARGGPASILICYAIIGFIVYITLLLLGEMSTQYPVAGFNDAVSVASDLTAAQIILGFWTEWHPWVISLIFLFFLLGVNMIHVRVYGELEYWLSVLKVATIVVFIILGIAVNAGGNRNHHYIGGENWRIGDAPFVDGFRGFASVFVTASFAYGGTESLAITAGETKNPSKTIPRVVKAVFFRILLFYILSILLIGLNVPYNYPNLSNKTATTSPFTIVFAEAGSSVAASFMNTVVMTSVLSAGNHALFAGTRVLYALSVARQAPRIFSRTNANGVPWIALLATSSISGLCFGSSFIGTGELWGWLQNLVGVSNQIAWLSIGLASWRFRRAWVLQGRSLNELKYRARWTWGGGRAPGWGPPFVVITVTVIILIQGWSSFSPTFSAVDFVSLYIEIPLMIVFFVAWKLVKRTRFIDLHTVDLYEDEHQDGKADLDDNEDRAERLRGRFGWLWRIYFLIA
ncbi:hypothetical protein BOTBODRAFT_620064 [Botryobasidium botryosum FD-172 SS1]|uniref:Amino acid permease/ SLC12A domain-containing protein n=1 Tax=Botryobasidium botryosum (strain FD-172 SS1) TaxID=930990 RepID=A0A067MQP9_BOTB1|nr:hypothetical protein BOTBODRAFT_620064 [Botryobasidium botryosum FD-172 SS1]